MRRSFLLAIVVLVLVLVSPLAGCKSEDAVVSTYKSLAVAGVTYDATLRAAADAHARGYLTDSQAARLIHYGTVFHGTWHTAREALRIYVATDKPEAAARDRLLSLAAAALVEWQTFAGYAREMGVLVQGVE